MPTQNFKLLKLFTRLLLLYCTLNVPVNAQDDDESEQILPTVAAATTAEITINRVIEIVFLHEADHGNFTRTVDEIMNGIASKHADIEINYHKIPYDRQMNEKLKENVCETLDGVGSFSILIDSTLTGSAEIRNLVQLNHIPYFNFDFSAQSFVKMMESYIKTRAMGIDAVFILQDETMSDEALYFFVTYSELRVIVLNGLTTSSIESLRTLRPTPGSYSIISDTINMEKFFKKVHDNGLVHLPERWNLMFTDFNAKKFKYFSMYPEMSRLLPNENICCNPICTCSSFSMLKYEALSTFLNEIISVYERNGFPLFKFTCGNESNDDSFTMEHSEKLSSDLSMAIEENKLIYVDSESKIWQQMNFNVYTAATVSNLSTKAVESVAIIDDGGLRTLNEPLKSISRFFRIGIVEGIPWTYRKKDAMTNRVILNERNEATWDGYCIDFIKALANEMNFTYELVLSATFGEKSPDDGTFDGVVGDLIAGEIDIIVAALKMTAEREEYIDFVAPYFEQTGISIVMKKPIPDRSLFKFMTVLRLEVWLSICGAIVATAIVIWILEMFSPYSSKNWMYDEPCGGEVPKAFSGRIVVATYWLFVVLMLATFTANLAAFLTVERMQTPVQSLEQLARQSRIAYTVVEDSDTHQYFKNMKHAEDKLYELWKQTTLNASNDEAIYRVWDYPLKEQYSSILMSIEGTKTLPNASEGFRLVNERDDFAFIHDVGEIKYEMARNCNFSIVGDTFGEQPYAIAVQQGSILQDDLTRALIELQKRRFFEDLAAKYWNSSLKGDCANSDDSEGITLESLGGVFIATIFGLLIAMLVLIVEVYYYKRKAKNGRVEEINGASPPAYITTVQPFENYKNTKNVLLGNTDGNFVPVSVKKSRLSFVGSE